MLNWGATADEVAGCYPGDDLIADPDGGATMATTLAAPPEEVWPWLVQMGGDRGGWYSWDWIDNHGEPSADRIVPEWQHLEQGQELYRVPKGPTNSFTVAVLEPNRTLVLHSSYDLTGRSVEASPNRPPRAGIEGIWGFHLRPAPGHRTRLVSRTRGRNHPRLLTGPLGLLVFEPVHFIMQTRQFHNLRSRVGNGQGHD